MKALPTITLVVKNTANNARYSVQEAQSSDEILSKVSL